MFSKLLEKECPPTGVCVSEQEVLMAIRLSFVALGVLALSRTLLADSDTVAFYPFTDIPAGDPSAVVDDSARRVTVTNAVKAGAFDAKIRLLNSNNTTRWGKATFSDDIPGAVLYSDWGFSNIQSTAYQSLRFESNSVSATGATVARSGAALLIDAIGGELAKKGDFTIEYFWKCNRLKGGSGVDRLVSVRSRSDFDSRFTKTTMIESTLMNCWYDMAPTGVMDGRWHHHAILYDSSTRKYTMYSEYNRKTSTSPAQTESYAESDKGPIVLGAKLDAATDGSDWSAASADYGPQADCSFAALRVTSRKLRQDEFMVALSKPYCADGCLFHWSMHGTDGATVGTLQNRASPVDIDFERTRQNPFYWGVFPSVRSVHDPNMVILSITTNMLAGRGSYLAGGTGTDPAEYRADAGGRSRRISSGGALVDYRDASSCYLKSCLPNQYGLSGGAGVSLDKIYSTCTNFAFTLEGFLRQDYDLWNTRIATPLKDAGVSTIQVRTVVGGISSHYRLWYNTTRQNDGVFNFRINCADTNQTDHVTLYVYYTYGCPKNLDQGATPKQAAITVGDVPIADLYGRWNHWAITYDPATLVLKVYWNGALLKAETLKGALDLDAEGGTWQFGSGFNSSSWIGTIDEIRLTQRVLEPSEFLKMRPTPTGAVLSLR